MDHLVPTIVDDELLALLGRVLETEPTPESTSALRLRFFQSDFSWQELVDLAVAQEIWPAFIFALNQRRLLPPVPVTLAEDARVAHVTSRLTNAYQQHLERRSALCAQLTAVLTTLNQKGIVPILLKGAVHLTLEQPKWHEARSMRDLDILVRASEAEQANQSLLLTGYASEYDPPPLDRHLPELHLPHGVGAVELHIEALAFPARRVFTTDEVWRRAEQRSFAGASFQVLPPEWFLLHGMLHHQLADHGHARRLLSIKGLWEFAMAGSELSPEGWRSIVAYAAKSGIVDMLASWVVQANRIFGLRIPNSLVISETARRHAEATFRRARAPLGIRRTLFIVDKLRFGFSRETLAARYGSEDSDGFTKIALRHLMFLVRRYGNARQPRKSLGNGRDDVMLLPDVCIRHTGTKKGRGAFARRPFKCNETVEVCPVLILSLPFGDLPEPIKCFVFCWEVLANAPPDTHALALGYGSMYNHSNPANMRYEAIPTQSLLRFVAARDIAIDEELTINYNARGGMAEWHDNNWFERMKKQPIA